MDFEATDANYIAGTPYIGANVKYYATFEHTAFEGGATRPAEDLFLLRAQLNF